MNWRSEALFATSLALVAVGVFGESWIGSSLAAITGASGATLFLAWFYRRGMAVGTRKFVYARKYLNIGLIFCGIGTTFFALGAGLDLVSSTSSAKLLLESVGITIFLAAVAEMTIALVRARPSQSVP